MNEKRLVVRIASALFVVVAISIWSLLFCAASGEGPVASAANTLAGKTVWIVDVNTNPDYTNVLFQKIAELLPGHLPGVKVVYVTTAERGNPFFLLKPENRPDAAIIGVGVCESTTPMVVNYAARAKEKGITAVICYARDVRQLKDKYVASYRVPGVPAYELLDSLPPTQEENETEAKRLTPLLVEGLIAQPRQKE